MKEVSPGPHKATEFECDFRVESGVSTYDVCGVPIAALTADDAAQVIVAHAAAGRALEVHLCNAYTLSLVERDALLAETLARADLNLPDGTPVARLGRKFGVDAPVRGAALLPAVAEAGAKCGLRHFFYGGVPGVAQLVAETLASRVPGLEIAGFESPPFRNVSDDELLTVAARIRGSGASVVWVGTGTPRQDYLVPRLAPLTQCPVIPVGAAFDFLAGRVAEAPRVLHGSGVEWMYRLAKEPRRLWRRYLIGNVRFVALAVQRRPSATYDSAREDAADE